MSLLGSHSNSLEGEHRTESATHAGQFVLGAHDLVDVLVGCGCFVHQVAELPVVVEDPVELALHSAGAQSFS